MTKYLTRISLLSLTAFLAACQEEDPPQGETRSVRTMVAELRPVTERQVVVGEIRPRHQSDIGFRISGKMTERMVGVGDRVATGDTLARMDDEDYVNRLKAAEADVMAAEAAYNEAKTTSVRQATLFDRGIISRAALDTAHRSLASADAALKSARVSETMAKDQISYATLLSDFSGVVTAVGAEPGQVVATGQTIVRIAPDNQVDAVFAVAEASVQDGWFSQNAPVQVALLSDPAVTTGGVVREVSPIADAATRTFGVKVTLNNVPREMLFGSGVTGTVTQNIASGVEIPSGAIFDSAGKPAVWIYDGGSGSVVLKPVSVASFDAGSVIVADGVAQGDVVVTAGVHQLREGQHVKLAEEK